MTTSDLQCTCRGSKTGTNAPTHTYTTQPNPLSTPEPLGRAPARQKRATGPPRCDRSRAKRFTHRYGSLGRENVVSRWSRWLSRCLVMCVDRCDAETHTL